MPLPTHRLRNRTGRVYALIHNRGCPAPGVLVTSKCSTCLPRRPRRPVLRAQSQTSRRSSRPTGFRNLEWFTTRRCGVPPAVVRRRIHPNHHTAQFSNVSKHEDLYVLNLKLHGARQDLSDDLNGAKLECNACHARNLRCAVHLAVVRRSIESSNSFTLLNW